MVLFIVFLCFVCLLWQWPTATVGNKINHVQYLRNQQIFINSVCNISQQFSTLFLISCLWSFLLGSKPNQAKMITLTKLMVSEIYTVLSTIFMKPFMLISTVTIFAWLGFVLSCLPFFTLTIEWRAQKSTTAQYVRTRPAKLCFWSFT